jgi:hypothetical protein
MHIKSGRFGAEGEKYHGPFSFLSTANKVARIAESPVFSANVEHHLQPKAFLGFQYRAGA